VMFDFTYTLLNAANIGLCCASFAAAADCYSYICPLTLKPLNLAGCLGEFTVDRRETQYHVLSNINDKVH
jgi:hypothetical protein